MIAYPNNWKIEFGPLAQPLDEVPDVVIDFLINIIQDVLRKININHLAYSGGIDSSVLLCLLSRIFGSVNTYTITCRKDHPDIIFAEYGSRFYNSIHHPFVVMPDHKDTDVFTGDNAVRSLFEHVHVCTSKLICGDGIDEFICGYHKHKDLKFETYEYFLNDLLAGHLIPLNLNSNSVDVFLPYLDETFVSILRLIPLRCKVDSKQRKKIMVSVAAHLRVPEKIIYRHKYGFADAFIERDKRE